jgi:hypothetical protein
MYILPALKALSLTVPKSLPRKFHCLPLNTFGCLKASCPAVPVRDSGAPFQTTPVGKSLNRRACGDSGSAFRTAPVGKSLNRRACGVSGAPFQTTPVGKSLNRRACEVSGAPFQTTRRFRLFTSAPFECLTLACNTTRRNPACLQAGFRQDGVSGTPFRTTTIVKLTNTRRVRLFTSVAVKTGSAALPFGQHPV